MLKIRLQPVGRRHDKAFRIVVGDSRKAPTSGRFIEQIGTYNPQFDTVKVDADRAQYWLDQGAQASGTVYNVLVDQGVVSGKKVNVLPHKQPVGSQAEGGDTASAGRTSTEEASADTATASQEGGEEAGEADTGSDASADEEAGSETAADADSTAADTEESQSQSA